MKVLITGGTGLVGKHLQNHLLSQNIEVIILSRNKKTSNTKGLSYALWNIEKGIIDVKAICNVDHIIHLAGANIAEARWTKKQKQNIIDSRVKSARLIFKTLKGNKHSVKSFISASGSDCYGLKTSNSIYKETDNYGTDFLAKVCEVWEKAAFQFNTIGIRTVCLRTGVVFAKKDSALQKMAKPISLGIGSALGSGNQILSFIHIDDLCKMYIKAINDDQLEGAYNAIANNKSNKVVSKSIAKQLKKPMFFPNVPSFVLKIIFGEMASILLEGNAVDNTKIKETGFVFKYPNLKSILENVL